MSEFGVPVFLDFEEKNKLFDIEICNWKLWPYLRFTTYSTLSDSYNGLVRKYRRDKVTISKCLNILKNCTINNPLLKCNKRKYLVFTSSTRMPTEEGFKCFITDYLIDKLGSETNAAELISLEEFGHQVPCYTKNILYCDYIELLSFFAAKLPLVINAKKRKEIDLACEYIVTCIKKDLGFIYDISALKKRVRTIYIWHIFKKRSLHKLISKTDPSVIIEDCSYSASHMLINELAHEMGKKVVEMQHGFISQSHIGYNYSIKYNLSVFPDYMLLFSEYWKQGIRYPLNDNNLLPLGYPHYFFMKEKYKKPYGKIEGFSILILSQHIYTKKLLYDIKHMCDFLDQNNCVYKLFYKLHPMEPSEEIAKDELFKKQNVELIDNSKTNLYECFSNCNIQIGASSTAIFEGIGFGLKTILMDYPLVKGPMDGLIENNFVLLAKDGEDAGKVIFEGMKNLETNINLFNEDGALERIYDFLHNI